MLSTRIAKLQCQHLKKGGTGTKQSESRGPLLVRSLMMTLVGSPLLGEVYEGEDLRQGQVLLARPAA